MTMEGGNTDEVYARGAKRGEYVESLIQQHPDCVKLRRFCGRPHHLVDYTSFRSNALVLKPGLDKSQLEAVNNFGMKLVSRPRKKRGPNRPRKKPGKLSCREHVNGRRTLCMEHCALDCKKEVLKQFLNFD